MAKKLLCMIADPDTRMNSFSSSVSRTFIDELRAGQTGYEIEEMNLYEMDVPFLDLQLIELLEKKNDQKNISHELDQLTEMEEMLKKILAADAYFFVSRIIGFGVPAKMKALLEVMLVLATARGQNTMEGKKGIHIRIEDDRIAPILSLEQNDNFTELLKKWSVEMMESIVLTNKHSGSNASETDSMLNAVEDIRKEAEEYKSFLFEKK